MSDNIFRVDIDDIARQTSMGLIGACVSRDMRSVLFPRLAKSQFFWRISTVSLMSAAGIPTQLQDRIPTDNEFKTADRDINKTFNIDSLFDEKYVLVDFFRDIYGLVLLEDGRYITDAFEFRRYKLAEILNVQERIRLSDPRYPDLWLESFLRFAKLANATTTNFLIQPVTQVATFYREGKFSIEGKWDAGAIMHENKVLGHMQRIALAAIQRSCLLPSANEYLELDEAHEYGPGPYHYKKSYFERIRDLTRRCPDAALALKLGDSRREQIISEEMNDWRVLTRVGNVA